MCISTRIYMAPAPANGDALKTDRLLCGASARALGARFLLGWLLVAALTALYLVFVLLDVIVDEVLVVEERSCDHRMEHDALRDFLDAKSIIVARTDVAFLTFFALEVAANASFTSYTGMARSALTRARRWRRCS